MMLFVYKKSTTNTNHYSSSEIFPMSSEVNTDKADAYSVHIHASADGTFATLQIHKPISCGLQT